MRKRYGLDSLNVRLFGLPWASAMNLQFSVSIGMNLNRYGEFRINLSGIGLLIFPDVL